ncbi:hypothetical protein [Arthrobacter sp. UYCu712]|uniref:hypothetical protein n=1 Tax=Arthrobacter sp. UYCu712 TaxID=3156340 RepID=UPI0033908C23
MSARVRAIETTVTHDCGFTKTSRTVGLAAKAPRDHSCERQLRLVAMAARVEARKTREGIKRECQCPIANHVHGERTTYVVDKCRCRPCTDAASADERTRQRQHAFGRYDSGRVDADPVRAHMQYLMDNGISIKRMAALTGLAASTVGAIRWGRHERGHAPYPRVKKTTADKILALKPALENMAPNSYVDSTGTVRRVQALVAIGWSQASLGRQLGIEPGNFGVFMKASQCTAKRALAVRDIYEQCWNKPQTGTDWHSKTAATRARNYAKSRGWLPPMAWDDDEIDMPAATPELGGSDKLRDTIGEDVEYMAKTGATRDEIAERLGSGSWDTVERQLHRINRGDLVALVKNDTRDNARHASRGRAA